MQMLGLQYPSPPDTWGPWAATISSLYALIRSDNGMNDHEDTNERTCRNKKSTYGAVCKDTSAHGNTKIRSRTTSGTALKIS